MTTTLDNRFGAEWKDDAWLARARHLLSSLEMLFDPQIGEFAVSPGFVHETISIANAFLMRASAHEQIGAEKAQMAALPATGNIKEMIEEILVDEPQAAQHSPDTLAAGVQAAQPAEVVDANRETAIAENNTARLANPGPAAPATSAIEPAATGPAQTYSELLRKLTAAEIFAAEHQALAPPGTRAALLPLLRDLRKDIQRLHSGAA